MKNRINYKLNPMMAVEKKYWKLYSNPQGTLCHPKCSVNVGNARFAELEMVYDFPVSFEVLGFVVSTQNCTFINVFF